MMTVKELKAFLADKDDNLIVYTAVWHDDGAHLQRVRMSMPERCVSPNGKYLRISWTDHCRADQITEDEISH